MFVPVWIVFLVTGLVMAVFAVTWGIRAKQFDDQQRARFLPLAGLSKDEIDRGPIKPHRAETAAVIALCVVGFSALLSGLFTALRHL